jgi:hypothetical protein
MNILEQLGIATSKVSQAIESLKQQVFEVFETPSMIFNPIPDEDGNHKLIEDGFQTVSNSNGNIHGKVSKSGSVLQMTDLIDIANDVSVSKGLNLDFENAELDYFKDESVCTLKIPLGVSAFKTQNGFNDATQVFLFIKTGFGGVACSEVGIYTHRFVCSNGQELRYGLNYFKAKHTEKMNELAKTFLLETLPLMMSSVQDFTKLAKKMDRTEITKEQIEGFRMSMFGYTEAEKTAEKIGPRKQNLINAFNKSLIEEQNRAGVTAWTLMQGATNYTNRRFDNNPSDEKNRGFIVTGTGNTFNAKAEKLCLALN